MHNYQTILFIYLIIIQIIIIKEFIYVIKNF